MTAGDGRLSASAEGVVQGDLAAILQLEGVAFQGLTADEGEADAGVEAVLTLTLTLARQHRSDHAGAIAFVQKLLSWGEVGVWGSA